ncbi:MAG: hypothetical protein HKO62_10615 [Gammaproteobacteria bacterium]|nr:hypothetical protein [Gammaproteobacteria bacterium]
MSDLHHKGPSAGMPAAPDGRFDFSRLEHTRLYRPSRRPPYRPLGGRGWAPAVENLLAAGYSFLAERFDPAGCLFRGVYVNAQGAFVPGCADGAAAGSELALVEQVMGVSFVSHELSDALHGAGQAPPDALAAIAVLPAALFETRRRQGAAAVLAIGDSGLVFRYPFLTDPPQPADCQLLMTCGPVPEGLRAAATAPIVALPTGARAEAERAAQAHLAERGLLAAAPRPCPGPPGLTESRPA